MTKENRANEAKIASRQSMEVTHEIANNLIEACRACGIDCVVAPFEADAQLAFLNLEELAEGFRFVTIWGKKGYVQVGFLCTSN